MERTTVTIDEIIATFSAHVSKNYPSPKDFRRNFNLLLRGKRERSEEGGYSVALEKNIVFLNDLVAETESLIDALLETRSEESPGGQDISSRLEETEKRTHERTARRHKEAFVEGKVGEFEELYRNRSAGGPAYIEKLEFNYRYLMTLRIFLFIFASVLAEIRSRHSISCTMPGAAEKISNHIALMANCYLGNVAVGAEDAAKPGNEPVN